MQVTYFLLAFCYVISGVMFGVGIVFVGRLWQELVPQFPGHSDRAVDESVPKSVWWLAVSFGGFLALGALIPLIDKLPMLPKLLASGIARELIFGVLAIILYRLWSSRRLAALLMRTVLLLLFTAILIPAAGVLDGHRNGLQLGTRA